MYFSCWRKDYSMKSRNLLLITASAAQIMNQFHHILSSFKPTLEEYYHTWLFHHTLSSLYTYIIVEEKYCIEDRVA